MIHEPESAAPIITIAIASRNQLLRLGLQTLIAPHQHLRLIAETAHTLQAVKLVEQTKPQLLIIVLEPGMNIIRLVREVKASLPTIRIIALHGIQDSHCEAEALSSGLDGMVLTIQPWAILLATIEYLCRLPAKVAPSHPCETSPLKNTGSATDSYQRIPVLSNWSENLTKREKEIIRLIGKGLSNKDIACRLSICNTTVRHHLTSIFGKLDVRSRQQLLIRAHEYGLITLHANG